MSSSRTLQRLLEPLQVKQVTLRNRIVKPAQVLGFAEDDGPDEVAYGVLYFASDESSFITGSELVIDGGWTAQ